MKKIPRKLKKKLKKNATILYVKPKLSKVRVFNFNKKTLDYEMKYV